MKNILVTLSIILLTNNLEAQCNLNINVLSISPMTCKSDTGHIQISITDDTSLYNIYWYGPNGANYINDTFLQGVPSGTYQIFVSNSLGCTDDTTIFLPYELEPISGVTGNLNVCSGQSYNLFVLPTINGMPLVQDSVHWYASPTDTAVLGTGFTFTTPPLFATDTFYAGRNAACGATDRTMFIVTVNPAPLPYIGTISYTPSTFCSGDTAQMSVLSLTTPTPFLYNVFGGPMGNLSTPTNTITFQKINVSTGGTVHNFFIGRIVANTVGNIKMALYSDNNNMPGNLIVGTNLETMTAYPSTYQYLSNYAPSFNAVIPAGIYWVGMVTDVTNYYPLVSSTASTASMAMNVTSNFPATANAVSNNQFFNFSFGIEVTSIMPTSIYWNGNSPFSISNRFTASPLIHPMINTTYTVTAVNSIGCTVSKTIVVPILPKPSLAITALPNDTLCNGVALNLQATGSGNAFYWNNTTINNSVETIANATTNEYKVLTIDSNGCKNSDSIKIFTIDPFILDSITKDKSFICKGDTVKIQIHTSEPPAHLFGYTNANNSNTINNSNIQFVKVQVTQNGVLNNLVFKAGNNGDSLKMALYTQNYTNISAIGAPGFLLATTSVYPITANSINYIPVVTPITIEPGEYWIAFQTKSNTTAVYTTAATNVLRTLANVFSNSMPAFLFNTTTLATSNIAYGVGAAITANYGEVITWSNTNDLIINNKNIKAFPLNTTAYSLQLGTNGCSIDTNIVVNLAQSLQLIVTPNDSICLSSTIDIKASNASQYSINGTLLIGADTSVTPTQSTIYTFTSIDIQGCTDSALLPIYAVNSVALNVTVLPNDTICQGSSITLNFAGATNYSINGNVINNNDTTFAPSTSGIYTVIGSFDGQCADTSYVSITVLPNPSIAINIMPNDSVCANAAISILASNANNYFINGLAIPSNTSTFTVSNTATYTVTGKQQNGCTTIDSIRVVTDAPVFTTTVMPNDSVCIGSTITINNSLSSTPYFLNNILLANTDTSFTVQQSNTYNISTTNANGCSSTNSINIYSAPLPILVTNISPNDTVCQGAPITISNTGASQYLFDNIILSAFDTVLNATTSTYTIQGVSAFGCVDTNVVSITSISAPNVMVSTVPNDTVCIGQAINISSSNYQQYLINNMPFQGSDTSITLYNNTTYTITGIDNNIACSATTTLSIYAIQSASINTVSLLKDSICTGQSTQANVVLNAPRAGLLGNFNVPNEPLIVYGYRAFYYPITIPFPTVITHLAHRTGSVVNTQLLLALYDDVGGAPSTLLGHTGYTTFIPSTINTAPLTSALTVMPGTYWIAIRTNANIDYGSAYNANSFIPNVYLQSFNYNNPGLPVNATPSLIGIFYRIGLGVGVPDTTYGLNVQWTDGTIINTNASTTFTVSPTNSTIYTISVTNALGCQNSFTKAVVIDPGPQIMTNILPNDTICASTPITIQNTGAVLYNINGNPLTGADTTFTAGASSIYTIQGTSSKGCINSITTDVTIINADSLNTLVLPSNNVCVGVPINITANNFDMYTFNGYAIPNGDTTFLPTTGTYTLQGMDSATQCSVTELLTINATQPPLLSEVSSTYDSVCYKEFNYLDIKIADNYTSILGNLATSNNITSIDNGTIQFYKINLPVTTSVLAIAHKVMGPFSFISVALYSSDSNGKPKFRITTGDAVGSNALPNSVINIPLYDKPSLTAGNYWIGITDYAGTAYTANNYVTSDSIYYQSNANGFPNTANPLPYSAGTSMGFGLVTPDTALGLSLTWKMPNTTQNNIPLFHLYQVKQGGIYTLTASNKYGCSIDSFKTIYVKPTPALAIPDTQIYVCIGNNISLNASTGGPVYWQPSYTNNTPFKTPIPTSKTFNVISDTNSNGCYNYSTVRISHTSTPALTYTALSDFSNAITLTGTDSATNWHIADSDTTNNGLRHAVYTSGAYCKAICTIYSIDSLGITKVKVIADSSGPLNINGQLYVNRKFEISPGIQGKAKVTLLYTPKDIELYNNAALLIGDSLLPTTSYENFRDINARITKVPKGTLPGTNADEIIMGKFNWIDSSNYISMEIEVDSFSDFYLHSIRSTNAPLNISALHINGLVNEHSDLLNWHHVAALENMYYQINYSNDGTSFKEIKKITALKNKNSYNYKNTVFTYGHNYYKVSYLNNEGQIFSQSNTIDLFRTNNGSVISIYPNPTSRLVNINLFAQQKSTVTFKIIDFSGRIFKQIESNLNLGANQFEIDLDDLPKGVYIFQLFNEKNLDYNCKVVKE
jgi:Secretion system C-terminal sorting domain/Ig-like domain CHU_C associated